MWQPLFMRVFGNIHLLAISPSHFLQRKLDPKEVQMIESSVLDKCIRHGGVIHIKVDKRSPYVSV